MKFVQAIFIASLLFHHCHQSPFDIVQDLKDSEEYEPPQIPNYENFNYQAMQRSIFLHKQRKSVNLLIHYYEQGFDRIASQKNLTNEQAGEQLTILFGEDFENMNDDLREMEIHLKAYLEREIDAFFLNDCSDKYFHQKNVYSVCSELQGHVKFYLMFENFFDIGWENGIDEICLRSGVDEDFQEIMVQKLIELRLLFKLPMNLINYTLDRLKRSFVTSIQKRFGKGLRFEIITTTEGQEDGEESGLSEELEKNVENELGSQTPEEFRAQVKETMKELLKSEFNIDSKGEVVKKELKEDRK